MTTSISTAGSKTRSRSDGEAPPAAAAPEPAPSPELLEFLGEFSDEGGEWIDPILLEDSEPEPDPAREPGLEEERRR